MIYVSIDKQSMTFHKTNAIFLIVSPFVALIGTIWWFQAGHFNWSTAALALVLFSFQELSITAGYHRLFSHRAYDAALPVKLFFLFFGAGALQGPAIHWSLDHRIHHRFVDDNDKDPYSINKGFMWAHMYWLFYKKDEGIDYSKGPDLSSDKWVMWQKDNYIPLGLFVCFALPTIIAAFWGDFIGGFLIAGCLKIVVNHHSTFLINSLSHCVGKQTYSDTHSARDNWFTAILTFGEGYHNYHHEFPSDYRNGVKAHQWDPSKWLIYSFYKLGLAWNLKRVNQDLILKKEMRMKEKRLLKKLQAQVNYSDAIAKYSERLMSRVKERINDSVTHFAELVNKRREIKSQKTFFSASIDLKDLDRQLASAKEEFIKSMQLWDAMTRKVIKLAS